VQLLLTDLNGHVLKREESTESLITYDLSNYSAGVYLLRVVIDGKKKEWKVMKE
jgi:predicted aspartyl protease